MTKIISACDCDYLLCQISDHKKHVHVGNECVHPNNIHHKTNVKFVKTTNSKKDNDLKRRYLNWGI